MKTTRRRMGWLLALAAFSVLPAFAATLPRPVPLEPPLARTPPRIDAVLDDEAWRGGPAATPGWVTHSPANGEPMPQQTDVYLAYDPDNLYFAFYCHDTEPDRIKTVLTKRDAMFADDFVGLALDAIGNRQSCYELLVNPLGVQGDLQMTGRDETAAPDWVWYSAGRKVADGYIVEIRLPLRSIRFRSGSRRGLGIAFLRRIGRLETGGAWPALDPGQGIFNSMATVVYGRLDPQRKRELLPALTYASAWDRLSPVSWSAADDALKLGVGMTLGITSEITAEATVNPDFSQVESDAFQVTVNQRYPVFYSEKRPFFQDAGGRFSLAALTGPTNMSHAVHTRLIADPQWGLRLTGEQGRASFALLAASDRAPGRSWEEGDNPDLGRKATFWVGRGKVGLGGDNYVGLLTSGREFAGDYSRALAGDLSLRFGKSHQLLATWIGSRDAGRGGGSHATAHYIFSSGNTWLGVMGEAASSGFRMDSAFYNRTGFGSAAMQFSQTFPVDTRKTRWLTAVTTGAYAYFLHDTATHLDDWAAQLSVMFQFPLQGSLSFIWEPAQEGWAGRAYRKNTWFASANLQPVKQLKLHSCLHLGDAIYYSESDPFLGKRVQWHVNANWSPTSSLNLLVDYILNRLGRPGGERVFLENILRTHLTYQFSRRLFARALVQVDSYYKRVLSDLLASYTLVPGTVAHLGYGSLHDRLAWSGGGWDPVASPGRYYQTRQSLFFKVSYLLRF